MRKRIALRRETIRVLAAAELEAAAGGHPTGFPTVCTSLALRATRSEADGAGPCPGEYSYLCSP